MEEVVKKLYLLREKIKFMRNSKEKALLIKDFNNMVAFLYKAGFNISLEEFDVDQNDDAFYEKYYKKEVNHFIKELTDNYNSLKDMLQKMLDYYHKRDFHPVEKYSEFKIDRRKMKGILSTFFWNLGENVLEMYFKMTEEKRLVQNMSCPFEGIAIGTMFSDYAYAIVADPEDDLEFYVSIAHEMGHIYAMYITRFIPTFTNVNITSEVVSLLFEELFLYFLEINDIYPKEVFKALWLHHTNILNFVGISKELIILSEENNIEDVDIDTLVVMPKISMKEFMNRLFLDTGNHSKFNRKIDLASFTYPIGEIIATQFFYKIIDNCETGMEELNRFILDSFKMSLDELMKKYLKDFSGFYQYFDDFMEKYQKATSDGIQKQYIV